MVKIYPAKLVTFMVTYQGKNKYYFATCLKMGVSQFKTAHPEAKRYKIRVANELLQINLN